MTNREKLILDHLPLVEMIAKTISKKVPSSVELEDLISAGTIGLIEAVDRYDSARANSLKTFAEFRIRGAIWDDLRGQDWTPRSVRTEQKAFKEIDEELSKTLPHDPTKADLAIAMGLSLKEFFEIEQRINRQIVELKDTMELYADDDPEAEMRHNRDKENLVKAMLNLTDRERAIVKYYFYDGWSLREIGKALNLAESRVSQLRTQALNKIQQELVSQPLERNVDADSNE